MTDLDPRPGNVPPRPIALVMLEPIAPRGFTVTCPACRADRNWLLIRALGTARIRLRCRCTHEWFDDEVDLAYFAECLAERADVVAEDFDVTADAYASAGFDGTFKGTYL